MLVDVNNIQNFAKRINKLAFKHEVQYWLDEPGTDDEKLRKILVLSRDLLHYLQEIEDASTSATTP